MLEFKIKKLMLAQIDQVQNNVFCRIIYSLLKNLFLYFVYQINIK